MEIQRGHRRNLPEKVSGEDGIAMKSLLLPTFRIPCLSQHEGHEQPQVGVTYRPQAKVSINIYALEALG